MARTIAIRFKRPHPGVGFDSAGNPKQGKVEVCGSISVTTYSAGGESLTPRDIGLSTIDWIDLNHANQAGGQQGSESRNVLYNFATQDFYIREGVAPANAGSHTVVFLAAGDSASDVELL